MTVPPPISDAYWIIPGRLLAGEYPGAKLEMEARPRLDAFRAAGVTSFVDVTEAGEGLTPYAPLLARATRWRRLPIRDGGCPSTAEMRFILDHIDDELARNEVVYVHCWGGHGRTGAIVGCWLIRHGAKSQEALERLRQLRQGAPNVARMPSPETAPQTALVLNWLAHDPDALISQALAKATPRLDERAAVKGVSALGETKDLQPEVVRALSAITGDRTRPNTKVPIPTWQSVGQVDVTVRDPHSPEASFLAAELKWGKLDEAVWDLFKMGLLATRPDVCATYLVTAAGACQVG